METHELELLADSLRIDIDDEETKQEINDLRAYNGYWNARYRVLTNKVLKRIGELVDKIEGENK